MKTWVRLIALAILAIFAAPAEAQEVLTITKIDTPPATDLTLEPTSDVLLNPTGKEVLPTLGYDINLGRLTRKYLTLHAAELWVETLVAAYRMATIGGRVTVAPTNILTRDLLSTNYVGTWPNQATPNFCVKYNLFKLHVGFVELGSKIIMESNGKFEAFVVLDTVPPTVTASGDYCYTVNRNQDNTGTNDWYAGDAALDTGKFTTGPDGFIDLYSVSGLNAGTGIGPAIVGNVRTGINFNAWQERWAIGNLDGVYGYTAPTFGAAFGTPGAARVTIDPTNGIIIYGGDNDPKFTVDASGNATVDASLTVGTGRNQIRNSECRVSTADWSLFTNHGLGTLLYFNQPSFRLNNESNTCFVNVTGTPAAATVTNMFDTVYMPVIAGFKYEASAYIGLHRATSAAVTILWYNSAAALLSLSTSNACTTASTGGTQLSDFCRAVVLANAPANATTARIQIGMIHNGTEADPYLFAVRSYFGEASLTQEDPTPWGAAGLTTINNGLIETDAINARTIEADSITSAKIDAGTIDASYSGNFVTIVSGNVTGVTFSGNSFSGNTFTGETFTGVTMSGSTVNAGSGNEVVLNNSGITIANGTGTNNRIKWGSNIFMYGSSSGLLWLDANEIFLNVSGGGTPNVSVGGGVFQATNGARFYNQVDFVAFQGSGNNRFVCHDNNGVLYSSGTTCDGSAPASAASASTESSLVADLQAQINELRAELAALKSERREQ